MAEEVTYSYIPERELESGDDKRKKLLKPEESDKKHRLLSGIGRGLSAIGRATKKAVPAVARGIEYGALEAGKYTLMGLSQLERRKYNFYQDKIKKGKDLNGFEKDELARIEKKLERHKRTEERFESKIETMKKASEERKAKEQEKLKGML
jgi:hypothetical protein